MLISNKQFIAPCPWPGIDLVAAVSYCEKKTWKYVLACYHTSCRAIRLSKAHTAARCTWKGERNSHECRLCIDVGPIKVRSTYLFVISWRIWVLIRYLGRLIPTFWKVILYLPTSTYSDLRLKFQFCPDKFLFPRHIRFCKVEFFFKNQAMILLYPTRIVLRRNFGKVLH